MLKLNVEVNGKTTSDLLMGLDEARKKVNETYLRGADSNDDGDFNFVITDEETPAVTNKWIASLKAFDQQLAGEWHSGSCTYYKSKAGLASKAEADLWIQDTIERDYENNTDRYKFTPCVLNYDESQSENIATFFKNM